MMSMPPSISLVITVGSYEAEPTVQIILVLRLSKFEILKISSYEILVSARGASSFIFVGNLIFKINLIQNKIKI